MRYKNTGRRNVQTKSLEIEKIGEGKSIEEKTVFRDSVWFVDGTERNALDDCTDVDLEASPCANTLPIRRTRLKVGERIDLTAAWVRPSLKVVPLKQSYERRGIRKYLYRSSSGFNAELEVDDSGLVTGYGNIWKELV